MTSASLRSEATRRQGAPAHLREDRASAERPTWLAVLPEVLFYVACVAWLAYRMMTSSPLLLSLESWNITRDFVIHRVLLLLGVSELIRIWRREYGPRDAVAFAVFAMMSACAWHCDWPDVLCTNVLILCARHVPMRRILTVGIATVGMILVALVASSLVGFIPDFIIGQAHGTRMRHCLGFTYALFPAMYLFTVTCVVCWLRGRRLSIVEAVLFVAANVGMYFLTRSRLSAGLAIVCVIITLLYRFCAFPSRVGRRLLAFASWAFPLVVFATIVLTVLYAVMGPESFMGTVSKLLGNRVRRGYEGVQNFGIPLLGQDVEWVGNGLDYTGAGAQMRQGYNWVDNLFLHAAIQYGLVYVTGLVILYTLVSRKAYRECDALLVVALALMALHMTVDDLALGIDFNVLLFLVASVGQRKS